MEVFLGIAIGSLLTGLVILGVILFLKQKKKTRERSAEEKKKHEMLTQEQEEIRKLYLLVENIAAYNGTGEGQKKIG